MGRGFVNLRYEIFSTIKLMSKFSVRYFNFKEGDVLFTKRDFRKVVYIIYERDFKEGDVLFTKRDFKD